jgi:hypothetical protein
VKLSERVQVGKITTQKYEQLCGFLDAERLGITERIYNPETARRRRKLARELSVSISDAQTEPLDVSLDELLAVPRGAWGPMAAMTHGGDAALRGAGADEVGATPSSRSIA